jgi:hypothetical protein
MTTLMKSKSGTLNIRIDFDNGMKDVTSKEIMDAIVTTLTELTQGEVKLRLGGAVIIRSDNRA